MKAITSIFALVAGLALGAAAQPAWAQWQVAKLVASDAAAGDDFGISVSIDGDFAIVGAWMDDDAGPNAGAAYIFQRDPGGTVWNEIRELTPPVPPPVVLYFGYSVSISGDTAIVGRYGTDAGSAYIHERNQGGENNWGLVATLTAAGPYFGHSVSLSGDLALVGAHGYNNNSGAAYIFGRHEGGENHWGLVTTLTALDAASWDEFGFSVAISGDTAFVGAWLDDDGGSASGSAYIFQPDPEFPPHWGQVAKLVAADPAADDRFGVSVALSGDTALVGASHDESFSGSAYIFQRDQGGANCWGQVNKLTAADAAAGDEFGNSVALSGDTALLGALYDDDVGDDSGSAYLFRRCPECSIIGAAPWVERAKFTGSDTAAGDWFSHHSVALSGNTALVGAVLNDGAGDNAGAAYVFRILRGDLDGDGDVDLADFAIMQADFTGPRLP